MTFLRRKRNHEAGAEIPVVKDDLDAMTLPELMAELARLQQIVETEKSQTEEWFEQRRSGALHDGEYNIRVSSLGQQVAYANSRIPELLVAIDRKNRDLARHALGA